MPTFWAPDEPTNDQNDGNYVHIYETGHWNDERNMQFFAVPEEDPNRRQTSGLTKWVWLLLALPLGSAQWRDGAPRRH